MSALQKSKDNMEKKMLLQLMTRIENNPIISQRALAAELGIALGLMNTYLKRCIKKGWVKVNQVPSKRLAYFLTPEGFKEKSQIVVHYLSNSLLFFKDARLQCESAILRCAEQNWTKIALIGDGDLAEIVKLVSYSSSIRVELVSINSDLNEYDAVLITDIQNPQDTYDKVKDKIANQRLLTLELLHISRHSQIERNRL